MRKIELVIIVAVVAGFMAYRRPSPPAPPAAEITSPQAASAPADLPMPSTIPSCPYVVADPQDGLDPQKSARLFMDEKNFLSFHPAARATLKGGSVQVYAMPEGSAAERITVVGGRVVAVYVKGKGKEFNLTRDGLAAPALGATRAEVLQSLQGHPVEQPAATYIKTSGPNWTANWRLDKDGIVESLHLSGWSPSHRHHKRNRFLPFHIGASEELFQSLKEQSDLVVPTLPEGAKSTPAK